MGNNKNIKPLVSIGLLLGMLAFTVLLFSIPAVKNYFSEKNITFPGLADLKESYFTKGKSKTIKKNKPDSNQFTGSKTLNAKEKKTVDSVRKKIQFLEDFAVGDNTALANFFEALSKKSEIPLHIWYYGDSQIEGDRITVEFRRYLQNRFGGSGQGYVPFQDVASFLNVQLKTGPEWLKANCFVNKTSKGYGFAGRLFTLNATDSVQHGNTSIYISKNLAYNKLYLLYGKSNGGTAIVKGEGFAKNVDLESTSGSAKTLISSSPLYGTVKFSLPAGTNYYGYMLEGNSGVQVDNCGIRGHSGDGLAFIKDEVISTQAKMLNTKLVVFQFGNNMIPYIKPGKHMDYYKEEFKKLFLRYKNLIPGASVLVLSNGDMGTYRGGVAQSYPYLPEFTESMRQAAKEAGCAFFSFYDLMQANGGILGWKKLGYAQLDGHLSPSGQKEMAGVLYKELMRAYEIHKITN